MAKRGPFRIAGETVKLGESKNIRIKFSESYLGSSVSIPVQVMRAKKSGPTLLITGAIHGDELTGVGIVRELLYDKPPELIRGTLILIPVVNVYGLENHSRYLPDRRDLNRCFPGFAAGSPSSRLAYTLTEEVLSRADYVIDLHSAAVRRTNYPNVRADMRNPKVKEIAQAFGCELIVHGKGPQDSFRRTAVSRGVPAVILEAGEVWKNEPGVVDYGVRGCLNVMRWLKMIAGEPEKPTFQTTIKKTSWVRAERGGFLGFHVKPGDLVKEGEILSTNYSIFGRERHHLRSPGYGIILGMTTMPAVMPGEPVYHVANITRRTYSSIKRRLAELGDDIYYQRVRDDLSTSVNIYER